MSDKRPMGRPTLYKPEYCAEAIKLLDEGKAKVQLCRHFRISRETLNEWAAKYPEFSDSISTGLGYSESVWIEYGQDNLNNKDFNSRLYELNMRNRFGWNKKDELKVDITARQEDAIDSLK